MKGQDPQPCSGVPFPEITPGLPCLSQEVVNEVMRRCHHDPFLNGVGFTDRMSEIMALARVDFPHCLGPRMTTPGIFSNLRSMSAVMIRLISACILELSFPI